MTDVSSTQMIAGLVIGIALLIFLVLKTRIHVFLALLIAAVMTGIIGGMSPEDTIGTISSGFGSTLASIGIIIGLGIMMGKIMEISGAAEKLAYTMIKFIGRKKEEWAIAVSGYIVAIPIFVDSAFVILHPLVKALSRQTGKSVITLGVALAVGLAATHHAVPPTPGPLGVAGIFGADVGKMVIIGLIVSVPVVISGVLYAQWIGRKIYQLPEAEGEGYYRPSAKEAFAEFEDAVSVREKELPSFILSALPIAIPLILIFSNTGINALQDGGIINISETVLSYITFFGNPIVAVALGLIYSLLFLTKGYSKDATLDELETGIKTSGIILLVTGAGKRYCSNDYSGFNRCTNRFQHGA